MFVERSGKDKNDSELVVVANKALVHCCLYLFLGHQFRRSNESHGRQFASCEIDMSTDVVYTCLACS